MTSGPFFGSNVLIYSLTTGDPRAAMWATVDAAVADLLILCPDPLDVDTATLQTATRVDVLYRYTRYDALVIAGGLQAGCQLLLSEDLQHGQVIDGRLTIRNPFLASSQRRSSPPPGNPPLDLRQ